MDAKRRINKYEHLTQESSPYSLKPTNCGNGIQNTGYRVSENREMRYVF